MSDNIITGSSIAGPSRSVSGANATLTTKDFALEVATAGANRTVTLPHLSSMRNRWFLVKVAPGSAEDVIVTPQAGQTIDGAGSFTLNLATNSESSLLLYGPGSGVDWWIGPGPIDLSSPVISGDIEFTNTQDHRIFVDPSDPATVGRDLTIVSGVGGDATGTTDAGSGGLMLVFGGDGGDASATNLAGDGGGAALEAGIGGTASANHPGGLGGRVAIGFGNGGDGSAAQAAGDGGDVDISTGSGGTDNGGGGGDSGDLTMDTGAATGAGTNGDVIVGGTNAQSVSVGRAGKATTIQGSLTVQQVSTLKSDLIAQRALFLTNDLVRTNANTPYTSLATDLFLLWDTSGGNCVQNLPAIASVRNQILLIAKTTNDANTLTIDPNAAETIGNAPTLVLGAQATAMIYAPSLGTNWIVL